MQSMCRAVPHTCRMRCCGTSSCTSCGATSRSMTGWMCRSSGATPRATSTTTCPSGSMRSRTCSACAACPRARRACCDWAERAAPDHAMPQQSSVSPGDGCQHMQLRMHAFRDPQRPVCNSPAHAEPDLGPLHPGCPKLGHAVAHTALHKWLSFSSFSPQHPGCPRAWPCSGPQSPPQMAPFQFFLAAASRVPESLAMQWPTQPSTNGSLLVLSRRSIPCARELGHAADHTALHRWLPFNSFLPQHPGCPRAWPCSGPQSPPQMAPFQFFLAAASRVPESLAMQWLTQPSTNGSLSILPRRDPSGRFTPMQ